MGDPEFHSDEEVILTTPDVVVKSVPFEAILTDKRIILIDRKKNLFPPKEVLLATIRDVEPGENAIRDPTLTLSVLTAAGETRQMILTFPIRTGGVRKRERDEWARALKGLTGTSVQKVIRKVVPFHEKPVKTIVEHIPSDLPEDSVEMPPKEAVADVNDGRAQPGRARPSAEPAEPLLPYGSFCTKCGNRLPAGSVFCNSCGAKVPVAGRNLDMEERKAVIPSSPVRKAPVSPVPEEEEGSIGPALKKEPARLPARKPAPPVRKPARENSSLLSQLFQRKEKPEQPAPQDETPPPRSSEGIFPSGSRRMILTAAAVIAGVLIVAAVGAFVYFTFLKGGLSGPAGNETTTTAPLSAATTRPSATSTVTIARTPTPMVIPSNGVYVHVSYIGAWKGSYGIAGSLLTTAQSGEVLLPVEDAKGTVQATFQKDDASTRPHVLLVEIYKDGKLLKSGTTTESKGKVDISSPV